MKTVHKYPLSFALPDQSLIMTPGPIVQVAMQHNELQLWAIVDTEADLVSRDFSIIGTGHAAPDDGRHVGSAQDGAFVWHVFETTRTPA